jgi:chromosome segregation ATPase
MKTTRYPALLLAAALTTITTAQVAWAEPQPMGAAMGNLADIAGQLQRLSDERAAAQRDRKQAQDELDALGKQGAGNNDQVAAVQKRLKEADDKVKRLDGILDGKKKQQDANTGKKDGPNKDLAVELNRLADERDKARADREKAKAELEKLNKPGSGGKNKAEALKQQIRNADDKIKKADKILGTTDKTVEFKATNDDEVKQAVKLPETVQKILAKFQVTKDVRVTPTYNPSTKQGGVKIQWKGNP